MTKPLWQTLLNLVLETDESGLSCQECYTLMDQYADLLMDGVPPAEIMLLVKEHLSHCPNCDEIFESLLMMVQEANHNQQSAPV